MKHSSKPIYIVGALLIVILLALVLYGASLFLRETGDSTGDGDDPVSEKLDTSGDLTKDDYDRNDAKTALKVFGYETKRMYFRLMSFGDYTGKSWNNAKSYGGDLDGVNGMNSLAGAEMQASGYALNHITIISYNGQYFLPYYLCRENSGYDAQTSDVSYAGDTGKSYLADYISYEEGNVSSAKEYSERELAYREFVYDSYLNVPAGTRQVLSSLAEQNGLGEGKDVVGAVAEFIKSSAEYSERYDPALDQSDDIVVSFLTEYQQGVCRHFASAATLLYRTLGIPARYVIGFVGNVRENEWTEIDSSGAHAWVEVYRDGVGWIKVEVTGSGALPAPPSLYEVHFENLAEGEVRPEPWKVPFIGRAGEKVPLDGNFRLGEDYMLCGWTKDGALSRYTVHSQAEFDEMFAEEGKAYLTAQTYLIDPEDAEEGKIGLYAVWAKDENKNGIPDWEDSGEYYTVTFRHTFEGVEYPADLSVLCNTTVELPALAPVEAENRAYRFAGWSREERYPLCEGELWGEVLFGELVVQSDETLYPLWQKLYTVEYRNREKGQTTFLQGTLPSAAQAVCGESVTTPERGALERDGEKYILFGWTEDGGLDSYLCETEEEREEFVLRASGRFIPAGGSYTVDEMLAVRDTLALYAVWKTDESATEPEEENRDTTFSKADPPHMPLFSVYANVDTSMYLRESSYGDYTYHGWAAGEDYPELLYGKYCYNYLTGAALGGDVYSVTIDSPFFLLPYYATMDDGYPVQTSDVRCSAKVSAPYTVPFRIYKYGEELPALTGELAAREKEYYAYVCAKYLSIPASTRRGLENILAEEGIAPDDPQIIDKIGSFVRGRARYNLDYDDGLDSSPDVVLAFLNEYREGICQHFAAAATLLFRAVGIPARYVTGYVGRVAANKDTVFYADQGHAWTEIYIAGSGWIKVDAVGNGDGAGQADPDFSLGDRSYRLTLVSETSGETEGLSLPSELGTYKAGQTVGLPAGVWLFRDGVPYTLLGWSTKEHDILRGEDEIPKPVLQKSYTVDPSHAKAGEIALHALWAEDKNQNGVPDWRELERYTVEYRSSSERDPDNWQKEVSDILPGTKIVLFGLNEYGAHAYLAERLGRNYILVGWTEELHAENGAYWIEGDPSRTFHDFLPAGAEYEVTGNVVFHAVWQRVSEADDELHRAKEQAKGELEDYVGQKSGLIEEREDLSEEQKREIEGELYGELLEKGVQGIEGAVDGEAVERALEAGKSQIDEYLKQFRRRLFIITQSRDFVYDGTYHSDSGFELAKERSALAPGHMLFFDAASVATIRDVGSVSNTLTVTVRNAQFQDVTEEYIISYEYGALTVTPRSIIVWAGSASEPFTGQTLTSEEYRVSEGLVEGHRVVVVLEGSLSKRGRASNRVVSVRIFNAEGEDVTKNYNIDTFDGKLELY